ncbi:Tol biopolymer transport system component [Cytobacillus eiseniae]|uniref:Tol biopolymer transport system component n=1 Tax=Cytobacillus eiseniae TaxID=762947 RepID=A0ABS4RCT7_9BACI|nr:PD40 domain-containing protein [Cytobacillus eiseniae]MBP2239672.1 Tol biopolymer transport system component [Cytobacillus eiseniae]
MRKYLYLLIILLLIMPHIVFGGEIRENTMKAAFIRDGQLWIKIDGHEQIITKDQTVYRQSPKWSPDGKWIVYQKEVKSKNNVTENPQLEIWVYSLETKEHKKIVDDGMNPKWSPTENLIAFQSNRILQISNLNEVRTAALGVDDYEWTPDGNGFIASSSATVRPDGWTNPIIYNVALNNDFEKIDPSSNVKQLFVIPKELSNGKATIISINATDFAFSPNQKWLSFIVSPTASWSMDSDMVCVLSLDGKDFSVLDETILHIDVPKWAPNKNLLGYIAGGGRIVAGFKNKKLIITELPVYNSIKLTPDKFADMWFTWIDNQTIVASRVPESEWSNDQKLRPEPSLYSININELKQEKITSPEIGIGDYKPSFIPETNTIIWLRSTLTSTNGDLWISDKKGNNAKVWIKNVEEYSIYPK